MSQSHEDHSGNEIFRTPPPLYSVPISLRPPNGGSWVNYLLFPPLFLILVLLNGMVQIFTLGPLGMLRTAVIRLGLVGVEEQIDGWYEVWAGRSKAWFGTTRSLTPLSLGTASVMYHSAGDCDTRNANVLVITVLFAPTSLSITSDGSIDLSNAIRPYRSGSGKPSERLEIVLPERLVVVSNHQAKTDWFYLWILFYMTTSPQEHDTARNGRRGHAAHNVIILLMKSLRRVPIIGPGMERVEFIFLSRRWASDRQHLTDALTRLGIKASRGGGIALTIFPEGTILSDEEREKSLKYADKTGVADFRNLLLPKSTGLLHCLRTLLPEVPDLKILDVTIGYPGVPSGRFPQEWYTPLSVYLRGVPPPSVHIHLRLLSPQSPMIPGLSDIALPVSKELSANAGKLRAAAVASDDQAAEFGLWLRSLWEGKEKLLDGFATTGEFQGVGRSKVMPICF